CSPAVEKTLDETAPPRTKEQYTTYVEDFVTRNLSEFVDPTQESVKTLAETAALQAGRVKAEFGLSTEVTPGLVKLAFYDFVILCGLFTILAFSFGYGSHLLSDDSSSMTFDEQRIPALKDTLRRVAQFTTILQPDGISVRFLNFHEGTGSQFDNLTDADDIYRKVAQVPFSGSTMLGTVLKHKIVEPMIIQKVSIGKLEKPLFVIIITDGEVNPYKFSTFSLQT
ncbi:MAG: hypothetical protein Q9225_008110, partial [Loekoesia sp. 1 TL-2023]